MSGLKDMIERLIGVLEREGKWLRVLVAMHVVAALLVVGEWAVRWVD